MAQFTTQKQIRAAFWEDHPTLSRKKIADYSGKGKMFTTDTRCAFVDYVDHLSKSGAISPDLADRVTLGE